MFKNFNVNTIVSYFDAERPKLTGMIHVFFAKDEVKEHNVNDKDFYSVRPICVKRGNFTEKRPEYYFNIRNSHFNLMLHSDYKYYVVIISPDVHEYLGIEGVRYQYNVAHIAGVTNALTVKKLDEMSMIEIMTFDDEI